jgi:hypothetical protein
MTTLILDHQNRVELAKALKSDSWIIACLCAGWCNVCGDFRAEFESWADLHPDKFFVWIDIEDQADIVGDFDVEDFPAMLIQFGDIVAFLGTIEPDRRQAERILLAQTSKTDEELQTESASNAQRQAWQSDFNLWRRLIQAAGA